MQSCVHSDYFSVDESAFNNQLY